MTSKQKVTAGDILLGIRKKHNSDAVIREAVIDDPESEREWQRWVWDGKTEGQKQWAVNHGQVPDMVDELPPGYMPTKPGTRRRIDALILSSRGRTAIEIKVTRADFRSETERKRRAWRAVTNRFIYAAPIGVIPHDEIPDGCGLWEFDPAKYGEYLSQHGLTVVKRAKLNKDPLPLPAQLHLSLAYRVSSREWKEEREKQKSRRELEQLIP